MIFAVLALVISFGYSFRPRISCCIRYNQELKKIQVKLFNNNISGRLLTNIKCEMALSDDPTFSGIVDSQPLKKDNIICLSKGSKDKPKPNYVFKFLESMNSIEKEYFRVRFLVPNFIGVPKAYEVIIPVKEILKQCITVVPKRPK